MSRFKLVTFDVTNTIIRVSGSVGYHYATVGKLYGIETDQQALNKAFKVKWTEQNNKFPNYGVSKGMSSFSWWTDLVKKCFIHIGCNDEEKLSQIASHLYLHFTTAQAWEVLPGSDTVLKSIKDMGLTIGVISNFDERLEKILRSLALRHYFDFVLPSQLAKFAKPDTDIFKQAVQLGNVDKQDTIHVGDNVLNDYMGARKAGIQSVLFCKDKNNIPDEVDKNFIITDLVQILKYFN